MIFIFKFLYMSKENIKKVNYDEFAGTFSSSREWMKWEEIEYFLEKYWEFIDWKKILDIWCGSGRLLDHFIKSPYILDIDYFWIDSSAWMIEEAKKKFWSDDFIVCDMTSPLTPFYSQPSPLTPLPKGEWNTKFETIFFIASFHHLLTIEERIKVLENLKSIISNVH